MMTTDLGLYVHIPFCVRKCNYCDFCSEALNDSGDIDRYIDVIADEAREYHKDKKLAISTLYFGGGTPSLLSPRQIYRLVDTLANTFDIGSLSEFSMEANPGTVTEDKLRAYTALGVNRLSIGLQSVHADELRALGRIHSYEDFVNTYNIAEKCGIDNISVDLMYGIPYQTADSFADSLNCIADIGCKHISAYGLIVEPGTPFYTMKSKLVLPSEDEEYSMYMLCGELLSRHGYRQYEISNYSKDGYECKHNLKYWRNEQYIGLGIAAHSYYLGRRYGNSSSKGEYYSSERAKYRVSEKIDMEAQRFEYAMMRLRLSEGFSLDDYRVRFGSSFEDGRIESLSRFSDMGLVSLDNNRIRLTAKGFYVSNSIMSEIL